MKLLVLVVDSLRGDAPSFAGGPVNTPLLDRLAAEGAWYRQAFCSGSWTIPSLVAMVTGKLPHQTGIANWRHPPPDDSLLSALATAGWRVDIFAPNPSWAFSRWPGVHAAGDSQDIDAVARALSAPGDALVLVHHWWTHLPYLQERRSFAGHRKAAGLLVEALRQRPLEMEPRLRGLYHRAIRHLDQQVLPRWLDALPADSLLLLTADHGEQWGELLPLERRVGHIFDLHGRWLGDATTRVPLLAWGHTASGPVYPGERGGLARGIDLAPTLASAAGLRWRPEGPGQDLGPSLLSGGDAPAMDAITIASHNTWEPDHYPASGPDLWRGWSIRTAGGARWTWDALTDLWAGPDPEGRGAPAESDEGAIPATAVPAPIRERLAGLHAQARGPAGCWTAPPGEPGARLLPADHPTATHPALHPPAETPPASTPDLVARMRTLGYLD